MSNLGPFSRGIQDYAKVKRDRDKYELKSTSYLPVLGWWINCFISLSLVNVSLNMFIISTKLRWPCRCYPTDCWDYFCWVLLKGPFSFIAQVNTLLSLSCPSKATFLPDGGEQLLILSVPWKYSLSACMWPGLFWVWGIHQ